MTHWFIPLDAMDCYLNNPFGMLDCALGDLAGATGGQAMFGVLVAGTLLLSFYLASNGGFATPAVLTALAGGLLIGVLPSHLQGMAQVIIFVGLVAGIIALLDKYVDATP